MLFSFLEDFCNQCDSITSAKQFFHSSIQHRRRAIARKDFKYYLLNPSFSVDIRKEAYRGHGGKSMNYYRIFCHNSQAPLWSRVGWILSGEVNHCMMCNSKFVSSSWRLTAPKLHCYSCGNVFCKNCIEGVKNLALEPHNLALEQGFICKLCNYGQDEICPIPNQHLGTSIYTSEQLFLEEEKKFLFDHQETHSSPRKHQLNYWMFGAVNVCQLTPSLLVTATSVKKCRQVKLFLGKTDSITNTRNNDLLVKFVVGDSSCDPNSNEQLCKEKCQVYIAMNEGEVDKLCADRYSPRSRKVIEQILQFLMKYCHFDAFVSFKVTPLLESELECTLALLLCFHPAYLPGDAVDLLSDRHIEFGFHFQECELHNQIALLLSPNAKRQILFAANSTDQLAILRKILLQLNRRYHLSLDCLHCQVCPSVGGCLARKCLVFDVIRTRREGQSALWEGGHKVRHIVNSSTRSYRSWTRWSKSMDVDKLLTSEMFEDDARVNIDKQEEASLLQASISDVTVLLGWQVAVTSAAENGKALSTETYLLTGLYRGWFANSRKVILKGSCLRSPHLCIGWDVQQVKPASNTLLVEFRRKVIEFV